VDLVVQDQVVLEIQQQAVRVILLALPRLKEIMAVQPVADQDLVAVEVVEQVLLDLLVQAQQADQVEQALMHTQLGQVQPTPV
jgi:hypothetical protein